jgi:hypothetical protein
MTIAPSSARLSTEERITPAASRRTVATTGTATFSGISHDKHLCWISPCATAGIACSAAMRIRYAKFANVRHRKSFCLWGSGKLRGGKSRYLKHEIPKHAQPEAALFWGINSGRNPCYECENAARRESKSTLFVTDPHSFLPKVLDRQVKQSCVQPFLVQCEQSPRAQTTEMPGFSSYPSARRFCFGIYLINPAEIFPAWDPMLSDVLRKVFQKPSGVVSFLS